MRSPNLSHLTLSFSSGSCPLSQCFSTESSPFLLLPFSPGPAHEAAHEVVAPKAAHWSGVRPVVREVTWGGGAPYHAGQWCEGRRHMRLHQVAVPRFAWASGADATQR